MRLRLTGLACAFALSAFVAAACGGEEAPVTEAPEADAAAAAAADQRPARPVLEFPDEGSPVIEVRRGQRVGLYDSPRGELIEAVRDETEWGSPMVFAVQRERGQWAGVPTPATQNGRLAWIRLDPRRLRASSVATEIEVDLSEFSAKLFVEGEEVREFTIAIGMPEAPTPTGTFAVTDTFRGGLNPAYGCCAVALTARQTRLPSGWLGGDRIAIHGTSAALGVANSHGCVRAADPDVNELIERVWPGTPVTIRQ